MAGPSDAEEKSRDNHHHMAASNTGYNCYSDASSSDNQNIQTHHLITHHHQLQSFDPTPEIYNLTAGMDMIGFPPKNNNNLHHQHTPQNPSPLWKGFFAAAAKPHNHHHHDGGGGPPSSSKQISKPASINHHQFYTQHDLTGISDETLMVSQDSSSSAWNQHHHPNHHQNNNRLLVDDPSMRCVFPCEGNERPSQGLSLSLSSSNPSSIGLQSFELRQHDQDLRFGPSSSRSVNFQQQQPEVVIMQGQHGHVRNSKYLCPAQELLNEFCNLGINQTDNDKTLKMKAHQKGSTDQWEHDHQDENAIKKQSLYSLDLLELQRRKTKLVQMLEEVDRRYKHYCDQMKAVTSSFESVAGNGAARVYSLLASRAMSRHFRCLRDGILGQIKATNKAMGDKDIAAPGTVKGETPRLRLLDQTLRQQRAIQQMSMMESHPWRPQRGLPERSVSVLRAWLFEHFLHPYPSDVDKHILARQTGLSRSQVSNWFINARVRLWKPMVEEMYLEELKENEGIGALDDGGAGAVNLDGNDGMQQNQNPSRNEDQKPTHDQLVRIDSECLSSIINNNNPVKNEAKRNKAALQNEHQNPYGAAMELDFSSYSHHHHSAAAGAAAVSFSGAHNYGGTGGGGVSLTLGLHQHGESGGVSLAFSPASHQNSLFYPRDQMEDVQAVHHQYSLLDSESQNLPYRNLMGAQLLRDLAG